MANRRKFLSTSAAAVSGFAAFFASIPFVKSLLPSAKAKALADPIEIDLTELAPGQVKSYLYRGRTMLVLRRTERMLGQLEAAAEHLLDRDASADPAYVKLPHRSIAPEYLVVEGVCTHLACVPKKWDDEGRDVMGDWWPGGFICPCHGSAFDYAGRVIRGPAPTNLAVPPHRFASATTVVIGEEAKVT